MIGKNFKRLVPIFIIILFLFLFGFSYSQANASKSHPIPIVKKNHINACSRASGEYAGCHAKVISDKSAKPLATLSPTGYSPIQFNTAYNLPTTALVGNPIIAIVVAYDNPNVFSDLNYYSSYFGIPTLPQCAGTIASSSVPCFKKIDQNGGSTFPVVSSGWSLESSLDVQVAHAICQNCKILLVEAKSNSYTNLMLGVNQAVAQGASAISNSYGSSEFPTETVYDSYLNHPGVAITFSSGDSGYGVSYPASSPYVTAVGGTTLQLNSDNSYYSESAWSGSGAGCSLFELKPSFQKDLGCSKRTVSDVSADADPNTGASIYNSTPVSGQAGWFQIGGTSLSSPIIAAVFAISGVKPGISENSILYSNFKELHDVMSGSNGICSLFYLCNSSLGYDGPTGLGTPNGLGGFGGLISSPTVSPSPTASPTPSLTPLPTPSPTPISIFVAITNPVDGGTVQRNRRTVISTNTSVNVVKVIFSVNGSQICVDSKIPFTCNWDVPKGVGKAYPISVIASDSLSNSATNLINVVSK